MTAPHYHFTRRRGHVCHFAAARHCLRDADSAVIEGIEIQSAQRRRSYYYLSRYAMRDYRCQYRQSAREIERRGY